LLKQAPWLLPYAILNLSARWGGYYLGAKGLKVPNRIKKIFSSQKYYWN